VSRTCDKKVSVQLCVSLHHRAPPGHRDGVPDHRIPQRAVGLGERNDHWYSEGQRVDGVGVVAIVVRALTGLPACCITPGK
jgi:hypothetical protein